MDKRDILFITVIIILIAILAIVLLTTNTKSEKSSTIGSILGKDTKASNLNNYIDEMRNSQTLKQRQDTIRLYLNTLEKGSKNPGKTQSPEDAPQVCELTTDLIEGDNVIESKAEKLAKYIFDETEYDWGNVVIDATGKPRIRAKKLPTEVLEQKKGLCGELAKTYVLMGECTNLPIYFIYGGGHAWNVLLVGEQLVEVDTTQGCFDCNPLDDQHNYPVYGLCSRDKCITMNQIVALASQTNIFDQTLIG
jgi:hypothetical protein